jgi:hypothetical protein
MPKYTDAAFKEWMSQVDNEISNLCGGLTSSELEDMNYADMFEAGDCPNDAAREALGNAGFPIDDDY